MAEDLLRRAAFLALGVGASGFAKATDGRGGRRYSNKRSPEHYFAAIEQGELPEKEAETIGPHEILFERLYTGLRLVEGVDLVALDELCDSNLATTNAPKLERMRDEGLCSWDGRRVALTDRGMDLHTSIASALVD